MSYQRSPMSAIGVCLLVGMLGSGWLIGNGISQIKSRDRFVTVKGLVERDVKADLALWSLKTKATGNDLALVNRDMEVSLEKITTFFKSKGVPAEAMEVRGFRVIDRRAMEYGEARVDQFRYIIEATVQVRSSDVDLVANISRQAGELIKAGVTLTEDNACNNGPSFLFTKLNEIKPEMLAEATKNARAAASQFAADSGSKVGVIRQANQGYFSITSRDSVGEEGGGGCGSNGDLNKKLRVVTTIDYYLD